MNQTVLPQLESLLGAGRVTGNKNISPYITLRTKTAAEFFFVAESKEDLQKAVKAASSLQLPFMLLGGGSNIAVLHSIIPGLVIRNMYYKKEKIAETDDYVDLLVSSGYPVGRLVKETVDEGMEGFEYHLGLPGSAGGALFMNSKWTYNKVPSYFGDPLLSADIMDRQGNIKHVDRAYFKFAYDYSILHDTKEIVLDAIFRLKKENSDLLRQRAKDALEYRKRTQPMGVATSGCFFQNISVQEKEKLNLPTTSAGYLIDKSGLKNATRGDFYVSDKHANFIINKGQGMPQDLVELLTIIKSTVKQKFSVELIEEVILI